MSSSQKYFDGFLNVQDCAIFRGLSIHFNLIESKEMGFNNRTISIGLTIAYLFYDLIMVINSQYVFAIIT